MQTPLDALVQHAHLSVQRRDYTEALAAARQAQLLAPGYADLCNLAGICFSFLGDPEAALAEFDRALGINEGYIEAHLNRAITLNELGRYQDARESFGRASFLERDGSPGLRAAAAVQIANAHADLGDLYMDADAPKAALEQYQRALEVRPLFHDIRNRLAVALMQVGRLHDAEIELRTVLEGNDRFISARLNLGFVLFRTGRRELARIEWERCRQQQPANAQARACLTMLDNAGSADAGAGI
jgi:tetratricopeptide (TPR) repeat protein